MNNQDILFSSDYSWRWAEEETHYYYFLEVSPQLVVRLTKNKEIGSLWGATLHHKNSSVELPIEQQKDVNQLVKNVDQYINSYLKK